MYTVHTRAEPMCAILITDEDARAKAAGQAFLLLPTARAHVKNTKVSAVPDRRPASLWQRATTPKFIHWRYTRKKSRTWVVGVAVWCVVEPRRAPAAPLAHTLSQIANAKTTLVFLDTRQDSSDTIQYRFVEIAR